MTDFPGRFPALKSQSPSPVAARTAEEPWPETDHEIVRAFEVDPSAALAVLYDRYASLVYGLALAILASRLEAEDVTQEVFLTLCDRFTYDPVRGSLSAFLITMTRSRAIDRLRKSGRRLQLLESRGATLHVEIAGGNPLERASLEQWSARVRDALARLPDRQRRVLELAYYRDLTQAEIAAQLDAPLGTVKSWARQALAELRRNLQGLLE